MWKYVARRALASIPVLLLASVLIFLLVREFGADPARQRCQASRDPQCIVRVRAQLELDRPVPVLYLDEMKSFVTGDWGNSLRSDRSVSELIRDAMAETVPLAFWAVVVSLVLAVLVGVTSARHPGSGERRPMPWRRSELAWSSSVEARRGWPRFEIRWFASTARIASPWCWPTWARSNR